MKGSQKNMFQNGVVEQKSVRSLNLIGHIMHS